jgi:CHAT domain-containing protein
MAQAGDGSGEANEALVTQNEIVYLQSVSMLRALRETRQHTISSATNGIAILADPVFDSDDPRVLKKQNAKDKPAPSELPRLTATRDEAKMIVRAAPYGSTKVVTSFRAVKEEVMAGDFRRHRILHFATHGLLNDGQPDQSAIVLSLVDEDGVAQNGFLQLSDIYKLKLDSDLVVLSACRSALGKQISGEGFVGLTRGFISIGAQNVVASLWKVDDEATAEFMNHFYRALLNEQLTPTLALQKAKQSMQKHPKWNNPYYWAAFISHGEYQKPITVEGRVGFPLVASLTVVSLIGLYLRRRMRQRVA